jgi:hypothetical protein
MIELETAWDWGKVDQSVDDEYLERLRALCKSLGRHPTTQEMMDDLNESRRSVDRHRDAQLSMVRFVGGLPMKTRFEHQVGGSTCVHMRVYCQGEVEWFPKMHEPAADDMHTVIILASAHPDLDPGDPHIDWNTSEAARDVERACATAASEAARKQGHWLEAYRQFRESGGTELCQMEEILERVEHSAMAETFRKLEQKVNGVDDD